MSQEEEHELVGGNVNRVVRIGDTVRRPAGPWTPAVHALLNHLHDVGFTAVPRPLGLDDQGREVLSYLPGRAAGPDALSSPDRLAEVGRLVRRLHDAAASFVPPPEPRWNALIPADGADLIVHHDLAPWNLVVGDDGSFSLIDWDVAAPGTRLWDIAYAAHGFVPLSSDPDYGTPAGPARAPGQPGGAVGLRLRTFVDAYDLDEDQRRALVPLLGRRSRAMHDFLAVQSDLGTEPWVTHWREGHGTAWRNDADWIDQRQSQWQAALLD
ncbi:MAG TPA: phosphotransferase [Propionibacteriaceae bacterium]